VLQTRRAVNQDVIKKTLAQTVAMAGALHSWELGRLLVHLRDRMHDKELEGVVAGVDGSKAHQVWTASARIVCSFSLRVFRPRLSIRGSAMNHLWFSISSNWSILTWSIHCIWRVTIKDI
jgi:hypothetical protein